MTGNDENKELAKGSVYRQWISSLLASTLCFTYGLQSGWISPAIPILQSAYSPSGYPLSSIEISWIASALCISAMLTCLPHSHIVDRFGRKFALINCAVLQTVGFIIKLISAHPISLLVSQTLCGIASGGIFIVMPLYIKEISTDSLRGILGTVYMLIQSVGILTMYALGAFFSFNTVLWIVVWIPIVNIIGLLMAPESPGYLVKKGRVDEAVSVMAYLRCVDVDNKELQVELQRIRNEVAQFENFSKISLRTIYSDNAARRASALAVFILTMLDISGNFSIFSYASMIIRSSGVTFKPEVQSMILPIVMIAGGLTSTVTVERCGRKPLMLSGMIVIGTSMCSLASILLMQEKNIYVHWSLPMLCIICSVFCHGTTLPVPYVVMSEIFNVQVRGKIMGYIVTIGWFEVFLQLFVFAPVSEYLGMYTMFYIFGGMNLIGSVAVYILMPETKGKSLEEIEKELVGKNK